ncbi:hypothetical protein NE237_008238 [Protea cynaroides]|uniref:Uncharacterized protein n=1 Tax=Protea cynaroides TaxID=273540 RepID=A0A9Q0JSB4_9MAGN|nr:hypothetical protein NE237_008238 [Protea cynaroides]
MIVFRETDTLNNFFLLENDAKENRVEPITGDRIICVGKVEGIVRGNGEIWFAYSGDTSSSRTLIYAKSGTHYMGWNQRCRQRRIILRLYEELHWKIRMSHKGKDNHVLRLKIERTYGGYQCKIQKLPL